MARSYVLCRIVLLTESACGSVYCQYLYPYYYAAARVTTVRLLIPLQNIWKFLKNTLLSEELIPFQTMTAVLLTKNLTAGWLKRLTTKLKRFKDAYEQAKNWISDDPSELYDILSTIGYHGSFYRWNNDDLNTYTIGLYPTE